MPPWYRIRQVMNCVNLSTPTGLLIAWIGRAELRRGERGLIYACGYRIPLPMAGAFTVGNVIVTRHADSYLTGPLLDHEERHATQYAVCVGLPMIFFYLLSSAVSLAACGHPASWNVFERLAGLEDGGYPRAAPWWRRTGSPHR